MADKWIDTNERLPAPFFSVLICIPGEHPLPMVKEAYYVASGAWVTKLGAYKLEEVSHWMPMPEPPDIVREGGIQWLAKRLQNGGGGGG